MPTSNPRQLRVVTEKEGPKPYRAAPASGRASKHNPDSLYREVKAAGFELTMCSEYHMKHGDVNVYLPRLKVYVDGEESARGAGLDLLIATLREFNRR